jgi:Virulence factor BrkB
MQRLPERMATTAPHPSGHEAETPVQIPARGWWQVTRRALKESSDDNVSILAGGVAFFAFLAVFPAIIATITLYGLIADPAQVAEQIESLSGTLPQEAQPLIADQLNSVVQSSGSALGFSLILSLLAAVWSASSGIGNLIQAVNLAYDEQESRGFLKVKGIALALTLGAIVFVLVLRQGRLARLSVDPAGRWQGAARPSYRVYLGWAATPPAIGWAAEKRGEPSLTEQVTTWAGRLAGAVATRSRSVTRGATAGATAAGPRTAPSRCFRRSARSSPRGSG